MKRVSCLVGKHTHKIRKLSFAVAITLKKKMHVPALCRNIKTGLVTGSSLDNRTESSH